MFIIPKGFNQPDKSCESTEPISWRVNYTRGTNFSKESPEERLIDLCRWNKVQEIQELLSGCANIDIFYDNGKFFHLSLSHRSLSMLEVFLKHCERNSPQEINERMIFEYRLKSILKHALETHNVPKEIEDRISPYLVDLDKDSDSDIEQDLDDYNQRIDGSNYSQDTKLTSHMQHGTDIQDNLDIAGNNSSMFE